MPRTCLVCRHESRRDIDRALIRGVPFRHIAQQYELSPDPVYRHSQTHLPKLLRNAADMEDLIDGKRLINELLDLHQITLDLLVEAREAGRPTVALKAIAVARGNIALMLKSVLPHAERKNWEPNDSLTRLLGSVGVPPSDLHSRST